MLYIRSSSLITPSRILKNAAMLVDGGKIVSIGSQEDLLPRPGVQILDAHGLTAAPGYIDWQLNGGFGVDFTEDPRTIWQVAEKLPEHGVTSFLPTIITSPLETYHAAMKVLMEGAPDGFHGAEPLGLHFEGPFLNLKKKGAHNPKHLRMPSLAEIEGWSRENGVWLVTLAPEQDGALELVTALRKRGVMVSAGHTLSTYDEAKTAFSAGVGCATHLFNAMPPLDHRSPGLIAALLDTDSVIVGLIPDGIHVHPAMVSLAWKHKGPRGMAIVTDAMTALGMPPGTYNLADFTVTVDETSARLADGTLAGSILRMDEAVRNLMAFTGCLLSDAVMSATATVARLVGASNKGALRRGADADIVLLDEQARVMATIVRGAVAYSAL